MRKGFLERTIAELYESLDRSLRSERAAQSSGWLQRLDPRAKLAAAIRRGSSASTVPMPTRMASWADRRPWVKVMDSEPLKGRGRPGRSAMLPSRLWA